MKWAEYTIGRAIESRSMVSFRLLSVLSVQVDPYVCMLRIVGRANVGDSECLVSWLIVLGVRVLGWRVGFLYRDEDKGDNEDSANGDVH